MVSHVVQYGFEHLGLVKITAGFYESNKGSKKVLLKVGFEVEGFRKKQVMLGNQREGIYILGIIKK